jgi:thioredoxin reductase (NADPH)
MDLIIVGSGPAGLSAAIFAARAGMSFIVLEKMTPGGKLVWIEKIENYPGFPGGISGPELAEKFYLQASQLNVNFVFQGVDKIEKKDDLFMIFSGKNIYEAKYIIVASGSIPKKLDVKGEEEFLGKGVSYCAICDAPFFKNKKVFVIGEGKHVLSEIKLLKKFSSVTWLVRQGSTIKDMEGVDVVKGSPVEICGKEKVESIIVDTGSGTKEFQTDGVFIFAGFKPSFEFLPGEVLVDSAGYIKTDSNLESSVRGLYACGDIRSGSLKQIIAATFDGAFAVNQVRKHL